MTLAPLRAAARAHDIPATPPPAIKISQDASCFVTMDIEVHTLRFKLGVIQVLIATRAYHHITYYAVF